MPQKTFITEAEKTAQWFIDEPFDGRTPTLKETHLRYFAGWDQKYYVRSRDGIKACRRLREIVWRCEILQPVTPYALAIGDVVITGEYAVLRSSRLKKHAFALYLRHGA
jgi:hypothetical protein